MNQFSEKIAGEVSLKQAQEKIEKSLEHAQNGITKWDETAAQILKIEAKDFIRTIGTEVEFQGVDTTVKANTRRLSRLKVGKHQDYDAHEDSYMSQPFHLDAWNKRLKLRQDGYRKNGQNIALATEGFALEQTSYNAGIDTMIIPMKEGKASTYELKTLLPLEVASKPLPPQEAASWQAGIKQYLMDDLRDALTKTVPMEEDKVTGFLDFRSHPTGASWPNSVHMHHGLKVKLRALLESTVFPKDRKQGLLERNVRFYREKLEADLEEESSPYEYEINDPKTADIKICEAIEKACNRKGKTWESILENKDFRALIEKINVNMFSRRELDEDRALVTQSDLELQKFWETFYSKKIEVLHTIIGEDNRRPLNKKDVENMRIRLIGTDEISQFGFILADTMQKFNQECALLFIPTRDSLKRFDQANINAPLYNILAARKHRAYNGTELFRAKGRHSYPEQQGSHEHPDEGDARLENRFCCTPGIGHGNTCYPNQEPIPFELMEGIEGVFAIAMETYIERINEKNPKRQEEIDALAHYRDYVTKLSVNPPPLVDDVVKEEHRLPKTLEEAIERFYHSDMAKRIYGDEARLKDMVDRRQETERINAADFDPRLPADEPRGPHIPRRNIGAVVIEPSQARTR